MDGNFVGFISLVILVVTNLILTAFNYGKLSQSVNDLCQRVTRLETRSDKTIAK